MELGIALNLSDAQSPELAGELARRAEAAGLDLVVVEAVGAQQSGAHSDGAPPAGAPPVQGLDTWTTASWIAGLTTRIQIGVATDASQADGPKEHDATDPLAPYASVEAKANDSLDLLAGPRILRSRSTWVRAPRGAGPEELGSLASAGLPVVVPVRSVEDVDRVAAAASQLAATLAPMQRRSASARARRRPGIDYDSVPTTLADRAVEPGDAAYRSVSSTYLRGGAPGIVLRPTSVSEVSDALDFARRHTHLPLGVRSGGHGVSGRSTNIGGIVIDVGAMNRVEVLDRDRRLVRIGPGATWKQVAAALDPYDWALGSGDYGGVGVGGLATAGGIGLLSREFGLTIDHLRAVDLVLADGTSVRASRESNPDLFWAVRGAGANFGIATSFEFEVDEVADVGWGQLVLIAPDIEGGLRLFGDLASQAPRDTTVFLVTGPASEGRSVVQLYAMVDSPDPDVVIDRLTPFLELGTLAQQQVSLARYKDVMALAGDVGPDGHHGFGEPVSRSALIPALTDELARDTADLLRSGVVRFFQLRTMGGAISDPADDDTAFSGRNAAFQVTAMGVDQAQLDSAWDRIGHHFDGLYLSFDTDLRPERVRDAFPPHVLARLRALKRRYDPDNLFRDNFNIDPGLRDEHHLILANIDAFEESAS